MHLWGVPQAPHAALHWLFHLLMSIHTHGVLPPSPRAVESHSCPSLLDGHGFVPPPSLFGTRNRQLSTAFPCSGSGTSEGHIPRSAVAGSEGTGLQTAPSGSLRGERPPLSVHFCYGTSSGVFSRLRIVSVTFPENVPFLPFAYFCPELLLFFLLICRHLTYFREVGSLSVQRFANSFVLLFGLFRVEVSVLCNCVELSFLLWLLESIA